MSANGNNPYENRRAAIEARLRDLDDSENALRSTLWKVQAEQYDLYCELANHERSQCQSTPDTG